MMSRRRLSILWALLFLLGLGTRSSGAAESPPNFLIILTDDQGYQDLGCFGSSQIKTPHIDRMAREGMRLTSFYAQAVCGPSRAALMTGCYPIRVGEPGNRKNQHTILHPQELTLAEVLKTQGYHTACIGKWHLGQKQGDGWDPATMPNGQGFDYFYGTPLFNGFTVNVNDTEFRSQLLRNGKVIEEAVESWDGITADYTREAIDFIKQHQDRPFFLYLAHNMPHIPLGASKKFQGQSGYGPYGDAIEEIDWSTGQILATLRELKLAENTLVIFTSDNGPWIETTRGNAAEGKPFIPRNHSGTADPLRGYKMLTWEGGLRVPGVAWWPGKIPGGQACDQVAATIDLLPTFAKLGGASLPEELRIDGRDIWPLLSGDPKAKSPHDESGFFYYRYTALEAVRNDRWKLVLPRPEHPPWTGFSGRFAGSGVEELTLYDLESDIGEARNVAQKYPEVVAKLMKRIESAREDLGDYNRIGQVARFHDSGPKRPDLWGKRRTRSATQPVGYDQAEPVGNLRFDFESGDLQGWQVVKGQFEQLVTDRKGLPNHPQQPFNKQGKFLLFTGHRTKQARGDDSQVGIIESPAFVLRGDQMSFLVGGGAGKNTYVALYSEAGKELLKASGQNGPALRRILWDVSEYRGQTLKLRIVDQSRGGWGHVTFDDFSCEGELAAAPEPQAASDSSERTSGYQVTKPPASMKLPEFYEKYVDASGYPVVSSGKVNDYALKEAAYLVDLMLAKRPDVRKAMVESGSRLIVIGHNEFTTDIPEYGHLKPKDYWDARARGLGGSLTDPVCSCAEENMLAYEGDPYQAENILIHEFAHNIHLRGMVRVDKSFDDRLKNAYEAAIAQGLWAGAYASTNHHEYFAEGVQSWFNNNRPPDHDHNHVDTRSELREYDPGLAALCEEVFGVTELVYSKPATRLSGHLAGYDPKTAPKFEWPAHLQKQRQEIREKAQARRDGAKKP